MYAVDSQDGPQQLKRWGEMVKERAESADKIMSVLEVTLFSNAYARSPCRID
jgi:hypothetical protein